MKNDNDVVIQASDINIAYDSELGTYINGTIIDYSNGWFNRGFSIRGGYLSSC